MSAATLTSYSGPRSRRAQELPELVPIMWFQVQDLEASELLWLNTVSINEVKDGDKDGDKDEDGNKDEDEYKDKDGNGDGDGDGDRDGDEDEDEGEECRESWYFLFRSLYPDTRF